MTVIHSASLVRILHGFDAARIAALAEVNFRTAARWQSGESSPGWLEMARLMQGEPEIFNRIARLVGQPEAGARAVSLAQVRILAGVLDDALALPPKRPD